MTSSHSKAISGEIEYQVQTMPNVNARESWTTGWLKIDPSMVLSIAPAFSMGAIHQASGPTANAGVHYIFALQTLTVGPPESVKDWSTGVIGTIKKNDASNMLCRVAG